MGGNSRFWSRDPATPANTKIPLRNSPLSKSYKSWGYEIAWGYENIPQTPDFLLAILLSQQNPTFHSEIHPCPNPPSPGVSKAPGVTKRPVETADFWSAILQSQQVPKFFSEMPPDPNPTSPGVMKPAGAAKTPDKAADCWWKS